MRANPLVAVGTAFALGLLARAVKSEFEIPRDIYTGLSIYLLLALGLHGGAELARASSNQILWPALATLAVGVITPVSAYLTLRRVGRMGPSDAAGIAAHYGSVSAVTFIAAQQFAKSQGAEPEGFMPTLLTLLVINAFAAAMIGRLRSLPLTFAGAVLLVGPSTRVRRESQMDARTRARLLSGEAEDPEGTRGT